MGDWSKKQPAPQTRENDTVEFSELTAGEPVTGFTEAPRVGLAATAAGPGVPPSRKVIR